MVGYTQNGILGEAIADLAENPSLSAQVNSVAGKWGETRYPTIKRTALATTFWRFAMRDVAGAAFTPPSRLTSEDWTYVYPVPANSLRLVGLYETTDYALIRDHIYSDYDSPTIIYIDDVSETYFPPYFVSYLIAALQEKMVYALTNDSEMRDWYTKQTHREFVKALPIDSSQSVIRSIEEVLSRVLKTDTRRR